MLDDRMEPKLRSPSHSKADTPRREQREQHAADKLPECIRRASVIQLTSPRAIHRDQSAGSSVTILTSGLGPETLTVWTHRKGRSPTMTVTGARPAGPPVSSPEQATPLFSGGSPSFEDVSIEGGSNDYERKA